jgi:NADP-dependent 3-hydroxy acid dehydrogenase YdfG
MSGLGGKIAWITGAGSGIGRAGAMALAEAGATVILSGRRAEQLAETASQIGARAECLPLDVTDAEAVAAAAETIAARHGGIDILVNSAGMNLPQRYFKNLTVETWDRVVHVNLDGALYCTHAVLPGMRARGGGLVINVASWAGRDHVYFTGAAYTASKHALVALTMSLNMEEGRNGIRATALCPGEVATPILKNRPVPPSAEEVDRMLQPDDLGRTIRFVAEMPPHVTINEILIGPTWNRMFLGGEDLPTP